MVNYNRIFGIGCLVYFSNFLLGIMLVQIFEIDFFNRLSNYSPFLSILLTLVIVWLCTALYFKNEHSDFKQGLQVGIGFILVGFLFDLVFAFIGLSLGQPVEILIEYYKDIWFWVTVVLVILVSGITADLIQKKQ